MYSSLFVSQQLPPSTVNPFALRCLLPSNGLLKVVKSVNKLEYRQAAPARIQLPFKSFERFARSLSRTDTHRVGERQSKRGTEKE